MKEGVQQYDLRTRWYNLVLEVIKKGWKSWQEIEKERVKKEETGDFSSIDLYKMEMMLEEEV